MSMRPTVERCGVYAAPPDLSAVREAAAAAGVTWNEVDLAGVGDKGTLLARVGGALRFPAHFGANWDALADCLQDLPQPQGHLLSLRGSDAVRRALGADWDVFLEILAETADYWKARGRVFIVLVEAARGLPVWR